MLFPHLLGREAYRPTLWDLESDSRARTHWREMFRQHFDSLPLLLGTDAGEHSQASLERVRRQLFAVLDEPKSVTDHPHVHAWTTLRESLLRQHGLPDLYRDVKRRENQRAISMLPEVLHRLDSARDPALRCRQTIAGLLAGNLFDLGSPATIGRPVGDRFHDQVDELLGRSWLYDDTAALVNHLAELRPTGRVLMLVDNSGPDFVCGAAVLAIELVRDGHTVVLAANERPSLNDVTASELRALLPVLAATDPRAAVLAEPRRVDVVSTGTGEPGIDLSDVSLELADAARACDLLVLIGQGRALETNWEARLSVPTLRVSTIKDALVAERLGGRRFDGVCQLRPPADD